MRFTKNSFCLGGFVLAVLFYFAQNLFAANTPATTGEFSSALTEIKKKLDDSRKRDEQILENQKTILAEIKKTQIWVKQN